MPVSCKISFQSALQQLLSTTCSIKLSKQNYTVLHSPLSSNRCYSDPGRKQRHLRLKPEAPGFRQHGAYSSHASLSELCKTSQGPPRRAATTQALLLGIRQQNGHVSTYRWDLSCRVAGFFSTVWAIWHRVRSLTLQTAYKVKSWVKLHSIYETLQGKKSIASHSKPLFMAS